LLVYREEVKNKLTLISTEL